MRACWPNKGRNSRSGAVNLLRFYYLKGVPMNIRKKKLEITGWPVYPIAVGETALISEDTGMRRTSTVLRMKKESQTEVRFETLNTSYRLHLSASGGAK